METTFHSVSEEWLLKSLVKKEDNVLIERQSREKSVNLPQWKQTDFLKYLLLTGNEIDLKKVLCLHLFAITVPPKACKRGDQTLMKIYEFTNYTFFLPNYYLHKSNHGQLYCSCWEEENSLKTGKLRSYTTHLAVNVSIVNVIASVLKVLTTLDNNLLKKLVSMSHSLCFINKLLKTDHYKSYIRMLRFSGLFHDRNKLRTEECTIIRATSRLVSEVAHIKKNMVFTIWMPNTSSEKITEIRAKSSEKKKNATSDEKNTMNPSQSTHHHLQQKYPNPIINQLNLKYLPIYDNRGNVDSKKMNSCINYIVNCKLYVSFLFLEFIIYCSHLNMTQHF
ncbi:uncharacterized protein [Halyomorpha halys]|uniref:uncharacterized protein isoform X2 n=1 Tax=Halyomorpha halys TaxID=286706 RepID=UPI0034D2F582